MRSFLNRLQTQNKIAIQLATGTFTAGFVTFLLYVITGNEDYAFLGILFIALAALFNSILFLVVLGNTLFGSVSWKEGLFTIYVLILNVPITAFYLYINFKIL
jgi:hypothetical protein